ncbi:glycosyltransferase [Chelatococcus sp. GCM10030263]|uniref:glycosyltransferase n=1 Tax=Chelatococcus sp. GCM10030263 TaxID=3273387 RepID=UPI0036164E63
MIDIGTRPSIGIVLGGFAGGGAQRDSVLLGNALAKLGAAVTLIVLRTEGPLRALVDPGIATVKVPSRLRRAIPQLRRVFGDSDFDVVLSSEASLNLGCVLAARLLPRRQRPPLILREVGVPSVGLRHDPYLQNRVAYRLGFFYRYADHVLTLTEGACDDLVRQSHVPRVMMSMMVSKPVITPEVAASLDSFATAEREEGLIVCMGRLSTEKGQAHLVEAAALLPRSRPWRLTFVGEGAEQPALEQRIAALGLADRVIFAGYAKDPFSWFKRAELAVSASLFEGFGNSLVEALACGTPVVAVDCPYGPREILDGGRYGMLVPPGDARQLAAAIEQSLGQTVDRRRLMERGLLHRTDRSAQELLHIARDLCERVDSRRLGRLSEA